ncbi:hypothetical protein UY286_26345 [Paenibacillus polymyxa]|uniref:DUF6809 family protein n=1 Tax=Paenibacillus TaxID=44249 RepID=UPI002AB394AF|nr:DUF6809 family protein [Paenibacillus polymyxa]MDY7994241.1 hypothetical protein [Paenibacillus polymyxa]MDY8120931.1 hypothetical protein [Paenibacillus polymyxa]
MILEDIYYGKWRPSEQINSTDPESQKVNQKISDLMEMLKSKLPAAFIHGYRAGALTMIEVFSEDKEIVDPNR